MLFICQMHHYSSDSYHIDVKSKNGEIILHEINRQSPLYLKLLPLLKVVYKRKEAEEFQGLCICIQISKSNSCIILLGKPTASLFQTVVWLRHKHAEKLCEFSNRKFNPEKIPSSFITGLLVFNKTEDTIWLVNITCPFTLRISPPSYPSSFCLTRINARAASLFPSTSSSEAPKLVSNSSSVSYHRKAH